MVAKQLLAVSLLNMVLHLLYLTL